jgi:Pyrimidine dimer DNA glycosylase
MNIFATSPCPVVSAIELDDKRVVKMVLESAQILSTTVYLLSGILYTDLYRPTHAKHPCTIWACASLKNWEWLYSHMEALCEEYTFRYDKVHKSSFLMEKFLQYKSICNLTGDLTPFANCTRSESLGVDFRSITDVHYAYKLYMCAKYFSNPAKTKWTRRGAPDWFLPEKGYFEIL